MSKSEEFDAAMTRLKEIEKSVSSEDTSLEECLDLLDESVALADICVKSVNSGLEESAETSQAETANTETSSDNSAAEETEVDEAVAAGSANDEPSADLSNDDPASESAEEQETAE